MRGTISLADERAKQLRRLAAHHGKHITELIEDWIAAEWRQLGYDPVLPNGFGLSHPTCDTPNAPLGIEVEGLGSVDLEYEEAREIALALIALADGDQSAPTRIDGTKRGGHLVEVRRQGKGISYLVNGRKKGLTYGLARDLGYALGQRGDAFEPHERGPKNAKLDEHTNGENEQPPEWGSW
ncbi:hypothetical protein CKO28_14565 [Rhodovibrio sodomensis]|uniref:Uncharacterized protein n=1 Tax=Rhodovibrio sodomensis TaxID=1088 RepID=A0ABS1DGN3_9PROT|nr:hypothetical protein [Rhodovibrio sodomensis]MBK1669257.1 hypothetical protein [Rhodovibrio sodomensis]